MERDSEKLILEILIIPLQDNSYPVRLNQISIHTLSRMLDRGARLTLPLYFTLSPQS